MTSRPTIANSSPARCRAGIARAPQRLASLRGAPPGLAVHRAAPHLNSSHQPPCVSPRIAPRRTEPLLRASRRNASQHRSTPRTGHLFNLAVFPTRRLSARRIAAQRIVSLRSAVRRTSTPRASHLCRCSPAHRYATLRPALHRGAARLTCIAPAPCRFPGAPPLTASLRSATLRNAAPRSAPRLISSRQPPCLTEVSDGR